MPALKQMTIDFTQPKFVDDEKRTELISFRASEKFKDDLLAVARAKKVDLAVLIHEYAIKCYLEDLKNILLLQANGHRTVRELLGNGK